MIKHIRIRNFKSLGDVSVDLDPVTVLIGRSGTGKSNFVDALRFLRDFLKSGDQAVQNRGGWPLIKPATVQPDVTSFLLRFDVDGVKEQFEYYLVFHWAGSSSSASFQEEWLRLGDKDLFHQRESRWVHEPAVIPRPNTGSPAIGGVSGIPEITVANLVLSNGWGCYDFPGSVLQNPPSVPGIGDGFADAGENYLQVVNGILNNLQALRYRQEIESALRFLNQSVKSLTLVMPHRTKILVGHEVGDQVLNLSLSQESEGFRRFLAHLLALYQTPPKQLLVFEEPEKGIYPGGFAALADEFKASPEEGRGQVLLTTHSPELLNHFEPEQFRVVEIDHSMTRIGKLTADQVESIHEHLLRPSDLFNVTHPRLDDSPTASVPATP